MPPVASKPGSSLCVGCGSAPGQWRALSSFINVTVSLEWTVKLAGLASELLNIFTMNSWNSHFASSGVVPSGGSPTFAGGVGRLVEERAGFVGSTFVSFTGGEGGFWLVVVAPEAVGLDVGLKVKSEIAGEGPEKADGWPCSTRPLKITKNSITPTTRSTQPIFIALEPIASYCTITEPVFTEFKWS